MAQHRNPIYDEAAKMYEQGMSTGRIADYFHISRQAMWTILKRRGVTMRRNVRPLSEQLGGLLNVNFVEWMMGYPKDWTMVEDGHGTMNRMDRQ